MLIGTKYQITADSLNVILSEKPKTKKGGIYWKNIGYYSTTHQALIGLVNMNVRESELKDLRTITERQDEIYKLIESITKSSQPCIEAIK